MSKNLLCVVLGGTLLGGCALPGDPEATGRLAQGLEQQSGRELFAEETFGGNGRTCQTCHAETTGTLSPEDVQSLLATDPGNPLFRHDGLDGKNGGTSRITEHATIRITLTLPPYVKVKHKPKATTIDVFRGIPSTLNTPALDPALMYDLRAPDLQAQALGAIHAHAQNTVEPTQQELDKIADFQKSKRRFFSSDALFDFANGGPPPVLPAGTTASEQRGRELFVDAPFSPPSKQGICALCHSGPMLNLTNIHGAAVFPAPPGARFHPVFVAHRNLLNNPVHTLLVDTNLDGSNWVEVQIADPGVLFTPAVLPPPFILPRATFAGFFKTPQLWGVASTAPYFHDNSAKTLEAVLEQYVFFFDNDPFVGGQITFSAQDKADVIAFLKLL